MNFPKYLIVMIMGVFFASVASAQVVLTESQFDTGSRPIESKTYRLMSTAGQVFVGKSSGVLNLHMKTPLMVPLLPRKIVGDVDGDGQVAFLDALMVLQFVLGFQVPTGVQEAIADADGDGQLTIGDAIFILRLAQGLETASKPIVASKSVIVVPKVVEEDQTFEANRVMRLVFEQPVWGGDLRFLYPPEMTGTRVNVVGLSHDAVTSIQTETPGVIRIGFAQSLEAGQGIALHIVMPRIDVVDAVDIGLSGLLYGQTAQGQVQLAYQVASAGPRDYAMHQNVPNPFNPETTIRYELPEAGFVTLNLYDVTGQLVRQLVSEQMESGRYDVRWDGRDEGGQLVSSGVYFYRIGVAEGRFSAVRRMVFLK